MMPSRPLTLFLLTAFTMMAEYVGAKAARDTLFLSVFPVSALPVMVMVAAGLSIVSVLLSSRLMTRFTPLRVVPFAFLLSSIALVCFWVLLPHFPKAVAVAVYLKILGMGAILTSGFWSIVSESIDPHSARQKVGRIAAAGTAGGVAGGLAAERIAALGGATYLLLVLAAYHFICGALLGWLALKSGTAAPAPEPEGSAPSPAPSFLSTMRDAPYLRTLALLVILGTIGAAMIDFVSKAQAASYYGSGQPMLRFFALFYGVTSVLTFLAQAALAEPSLNKLGLARTVGTLPVGVSIGGLLALLVPGLPAAALARAMELVFRGSLFRAGYEIFYMPVPPREKRAAKMVVDVGFDRLGDAVGSAIVRGLLFIAPQAIYQSVLTAAILVALAAIWVATRLGSAYVGALEKSLLARANDIDTAMPAAPIAMHDLLESAPMLTTSARLLTSATISLPTSGTSATEKDPPAAGSAVDDSRITDPIMHQITDLRSGVFTKVVGVLSVRDNLSPAAVAHVIPLLAWDSVYAEAIRALRRVADSCAGQLVDALTSPETDFTVRRRLPRVLTAATSQRAYDGLIAGLSDRRFEVRYQCGRSLVSLQQKHAHLRTDAEPVTAAVLRELTVSRPVWEGRRILEAAEDDASPFVSDFLRTRASRSLEHVFTLLSLFLPREPLRVAFHGLHATDAHLRGTALEYLETTLPPAIRQNLWPMITEKVESRASGSKTRDQVLEELMSSNHSILVNLAELERKSGSGGTAH